MIKRYAGLDGMKGICALTVLLFHLWLADHGFLSVDLFFMLSGFVLALNYETRLKHGFPKRIFIFKRIKRIIPTYWIGLILCTLSIVFIRNNYIIVVKHFISSFFLIPDFQMNTKAFPLNSLTWFLFLDVILSVAYIYLLHALKNATLRLIVFTCWLAMASIAFYIPKSWDVGFGTSEMLSCGVLRGLPAFCVGILIYRLKDTPALCHLPVIPPALIYVIWFAIALIPIYRPTPVYDACVAIGIAPLMVLLLIRSEAIAPKWCRFAGKLSYPLYASQMAVIYAFNSSPQTSLDHHERPLATLACILAALAIAWGIAFLNGHIQAWLHQPKAMGFHNYTSDYPATTDGEK